MCRLFALHSGDQDVAAEFWLLDAPDSIASQSEVNADGYGMAALTAAHGLMLIRNPVQASTNSAYDAVARRLHACQMIVHLRYADTGGTALVNTHPFTQDGRVFAHNGVVGDLDQIEEELGSNRAMVMGDTDSERFFALITMACRAAGGDTRAGIKAAVKQIVEEYELYSLNFVMGELGHIWAFRYPEKNELHILEREAGGHAGDSPLHHEDKTLRVHSDDACDKAAVIIASEPISEEPGWNPVESGELIHIGPDMKVDREIIADGPPKHQMVLSGLAAVSQVAT